MASSIQKRLTAVRQLSRRLASLQPIRAPNEVTRQYFGTVGIRKTFSCPSLRPSVPQPLHNLLSPPQFNNRRLSMGLMRKPEVIRLSSREDYASFVSKFDTFLIDCDGVLWTGNTVLPGVRETVTYLRSQKKQIIFVTNNSMKSRRAYVGKFNQLGIEASEEEIFGSSYAAAVYISRVLKLPRDKKVYVLGERGVEEELDTENITYIGGTDPEDRKDFTEEDYERIKPDPTIGAVLCGLDQHISYKKLAKAFTYLCQNPKVEFIATNTDSTYPSHGAFFPGAGSSTTAPLEYATKRKATVCGKPSQTMMDAIFAKYELNKERTCMIGDRLNTDISFGIQGKLRGTLLVLTGVSSLEDCEDEGIYPQYVTNGFGDFSVLRQS